MDNFNKGRRNFLKSAILGGCMLGASSIPFKKSFADTNNENDNKKNLRKTTSKKEKVIILGIDGMDPNLLKQFTQEGIMPTFKEYIEKNLLFFLCQKGRSDDAELWINLSSNKSGCGLFCIKFF